jgi:hypothetical protein
MRTGGGYRVDYSGEQLQLAAAFLHEARRALDRIDLRGAAARDPELRQLQREAMTYWMRAERHFRACRAGHDSGSTRRTR